MQAKNPADIPKSTAGRKPALAIIFATVFLYLVGFGIIIPIIPLLSRDYGATAFESGLLMSCYSLMQFLFSPMWGKISDRYGRRPVLLFCLFCEFLCYIFFAYSTNLHMLFIARSLAGFFGASLSTASAYISDITLPTERSKGMALIGVAFGLGFVIGPALGGFLSQAGHYFAATSGQLVGDMGSLSERLPTTLPMLFVAALCLINFLFGLKYLVESKGTLHGHENSAHKGKRFNLIWSYLRRETVGAVMIIFFLASFAMSSMEATFILFMKDKFDWSLREVSFGFAYIGIIMIFTQGYLVRKLLPKWGERKVLSLGLVLLTLGFFLIGLGNTIGAVAFAVTLMSFGNGMISPSSLGSISLLTGNQEQGQSMGVTQSLSSLGRILGPAIGGYLYYYFAIPRADVASSGSTFTSAPFYFSGLVALAGCLLAWAIYNRIPESAKLVKTK